MRRSILVLACFGLAILPAQAKSVHRHHAHRAMPQRVAVAAPQSVAGLFEARTAPPAGLAGSVVVPARQSYFYSNENFYIDNNHWGY